MGFISFEFEGFERRTGKTKGQSWVHTEHASGRVFCRSCGRQVKSRLGSTCSRPRCQRAAGMADE